MQLGLETDMANPNFTGAKDPDAALFVRFFDMEMPHKFNVAENIKRKNDPDFKPLPETYMEIMVQIERPGDTTLQTIRRSLSDDQKRFPKQWASYLNTKQGLNSDIPGTMLTEWQGLNKTQADELKHYHFYTLEQVANASDAQINAIGMIAGMSPFSFRDKARMALRLQADTSLAQKQEAEIAASRQREQVMADTIAQMQSQLAGLIAGQGAQKQGGKGKEATI